MSELKAEIKAIQNELESIRANANEYQRRLAAALVECPEMEAPNEAFGEAFREVFREPTTVAQRPVAQRPVAQRPVAQRPVTQRPMTQRPMTQRPMTQGATPRQAAIQRQAMAQSPATHGQPGHTRQTGIREVVLPEAKGIQPLIHPALQEFKTQSAQIHRLSQNQDNTLRRLQSIAAQIEQERLEQERLEQERLEQERLEQERLEQERLEQERRRSHRKNSSSEVDRSTGGTPTRSTPQLSLPPTSAEPLTLRIHAPLDPSQMADEIAQMLRQRQERREAPDAEQVEEMFVPLRRSRRRSTLWRQLRRWLFPRASRKANPEANPEAASFTVRETLTLLLGAALTRIVLNLLLEAVPLLVVPVMILLMIPAAVAVHRTTTTPQSGITWGYRVCVILLGLLIGGRL